MAKIKTRPAAAAAAKRPAGAGLPASDSGPWGAYGASWAVTFVALSMLCLFFARGPLSRIGVHYSIGYNEGSASYFSRQAVTGPPIYAAPPSYVFTDYPPLSYHLVGNLARWTGGDYTATGRWVSVFAYLLIGVFAGMIVHELTGWMRCGVYAALAWWIWLPAFDPFRLGYNDPHLTGIAIGMAGLYCFVHGSESTRWLLASAVIFSLSLFTKHSLLAFPAAVAIQLFLTSRRRLGIWMGTAVGVCLVLLGLTLAFDGRYFLPHLMFPRTFSLAYLADSLSIYVPLLGVAFIAASIWAWRHPPSGRDRFLVWAFVLAHLIGAGICLGSGAGINHLFDAMLSVILITGVILPMLPRLAERTQFPRTTLAILLLIPFLDAAREIPGRMHYDRAMEIRRPPAESEFVATVEFLKAQPGPALCENLLLCYEAGKPKLFDAFNVGELVKTGHVPESTLFQMLESHEFGSIQLDWRRNEPIRPSTRTRFSEAFMRKLFATYKPAIRTSNSLIFTPLK
jgi:hypothetical protein